MDGRITVMMKVDFLVLTGMETTNGTDSLAKQECVCQKHHQVMTSVVLAGLAGSMELILQ